MRRRIHDLPAVQVPVNGKLRPLTLSSVIQGRLHDRIFGIDLAALQDAAEIETELAKREEGGITISDGAWRRLAQSVRTPQGAPYVGGYARQLLAFLTLILEAEEVTGDG